MNLAIIVLGLGLAFYIAWSIGSNDAANPTNTAVGSGALTLNKALLLFAFFSFIGALLQGWMVIKTFGKGIAEIPTIYDAVLASAATAFWITFSSYKGIPISTSQSSVGAVLGIGLFHSYIAATHNTINWGVLIKVFLSWVISPAGALILAAFFYYSFTRLSAGFTKRGWNATRIFRWILIATLAGSAYAFGSNDVGNATGVYVTVISSAGNEVEFNYVTALGLAALGAAGIMLGGFTFGRRVIKTIAFGLTKLDYITGSAAGAANALTVWLFTTVPAILFGFGMPISTTHASVSAILGVGLIRHGRHGVDWRLFGKILVTWLATVPAAATLTLLGRALLYFLTGI